MTYLVMLMMAMFITSACSEDENWHKESFYYYHGEKQMITLDLSKRYVLVKNEGSQEKLESSALLTFESFERNAKGYLIDIRQKGMGISDLMANEGVIVIEYVVGSNEENLTPMGGSFYVKLKNLEDMEILKEEAEKIDCEVVGALKFDDYWIELYSRKDGRINNALDACNWMYETGWFEKVDYGFLNNFEDL